MRLCYTEVRRVVMVQQRQTQKTEELYSSQVIFYSLNKKFSMYVQCRIELDEQIDRNQMQKAADETISRYPYFRVMLSRIGERYVLENNDAPFLVYDDPEKPTLEPDKNNRYLIRISASGTLLNICFCHALTDGRGIFPFVKTLLYYYAVQQYKIDPQMKDVRLAGEPVSEEEINDPYLAFDASSADMASLRENQELVFRLPDQDDPSGTYFIHTFHTDCKGFMDFAHNVDGSPNALSVLFLYRMLVKLFPEHAKDIVVSVAVDMRKALGVSNSHHCSVSIIPMRYDERMTAMSTDKVETVIRGRIIVGSDDDRLAQSIAGAKYFYGYVSSMKTLAEKTAASAAATEKGSESFTAAVSYPGQQDYGMMNNHIKSFYILANNRVPMLDIEIASFGKDFYFAVLQGFDDDRYADELKKQMEAEGIRCCDYRKQIIPNVPFMDL
jgi:hypothetical protein